ncbi:MAG TPA: phosphotransferase family protein [Caulobacteraceae bacterium]|jgi:aminoglycoside phosphotransferase (APT) family kinase protein
MTTDAQDLGRRIIEINRAARLGTTTTEEWAERITRMMRAQPDISEPIAVRGVRALQGGAGSSSGTLFFEASHREGDRIVEGNYVLRFQPAELLFQHYDLDGQVRIQRALALAGVPAPKQCWEDIGGRYLGVPGYVMARVPGEAAPAAWFAEGIFAEATPAVRRRLTNSYLETLAKIHAIDWRHYGLSFLLDRAQGEGLIAREINWYWNSVEWAQEHAAMTRFAPIRDWLLANQPAIASPVLCHGDTNFTNNLFDGEKVTAVLDWEMAFIGAPEADLAYALQAMGALSTDWPEGIPDAQEMIAEYERLSGRVVENLDYYLLFSLFRVVLILTLGKRAFPDDFQAPFAAYIERTADRMYQQAQVLNIS